MKPVLFLGLLFVLGMNALSAQTGPWEKDVYINGEENLPTLKLLLSDFSGDNRLDIISAEVSWSVYGSAAFKVSYRPNTQSGAEYGYFPNYAVLKYYGAQNIDYTFMDMDTISAIAGGVQELAVGYRQVTGGVTTHKVDILKKSGNYYISDYTITLPAGSSDIKLVRTGSFDGVGNPTTQLSDLAVTSGDKVYIYKNNGSIPTYKFGITSNGYPNFTMQASGMGTVEGINTGEFYNSGYAYDQNEGYNEILLSDGSNRMRRWKNNTPESGANWFVQYAGDPIVNPAVSYGPDFQSCPIFAADMNNDGVQDFLMKPGIRLNESGNPFSWPNNPDYLVNFPGYAYCPHANNLAVADFNNDGKPDIIGSYIEEIISIPSSKTDNPFICFNDGSNNLPDDDADFVFNYEFSYDWPSNKMLFLTGDISHKGAVSVIRLANTGSSGNYIDRKIVIYRRTDNPAPAPPRMKNITTNPASGSIQINWHKNSEADIQYYDLYYSITVNDKPPADWTLLANNITGTSYTHVGLTPGGGPKKVHYKIKAKDTAGQPSGFSNILTTPFVYQMEKERGSEALSFTLHQNFPNPFNPVTSITYVVPSASRVSLSVYNSLGQLVKELVNEDQESGTKQVLWNGKDENGREAASGVYVYKLQIGQQTAVRKMMFAK